jgi:cellobiose transport system permease protein
MIMGQSISVKKTATRSNFKANTLFLHAVLWFGVFISLFPFYWLIVMASNTTSNIFKFPPNLTLGPRLLTNVVYILQNINFFSAFLNTVFVACMGSLLILFFCSLAGFSFAMFEFPAKNTLFVLLLVTMMLPHQLALVPSFVIMAHLGWVNSFKALIIPGMANAFGIFWMRQYAESSIPYELIDAGRIDGCNHLRLYWHVALPILRPALAFLGIYSFINAWNDYLWPLIILNDPSKYTLQVALSQLNNVYATDYSMTMAGTLMSTLPLILIFILGCRQFIGNIVIGAVKE